MISRSPDGGRIMIVDDESSNITLLDRILRQAGFTEILGITDPLSAAGSFTDFKPDLLLLDLSMPQRDGFGVLEDLKHLISPKDFLPIVVLTGDTSPEARQRALSMGAIDFLNKPVGRMEVLLRITNLLHTRRLHVSLAKENTFLEERVRERTIAITNKSKQLENAKLEILNRLALAAEFRDDATGKHTLRVGELSGYIAYGLGLPEDLTRVLKLSAQLHDIGKIGIPDAILLKPGRLTPEEYAVMKTHTTIGERMLSNSDYELLRQAAIIAVSHHENWDGSGYPNGLSGCTIPLFGRIVAVADVFDALTHERSYKPAWPKELAIKEIGKMAGTKFEPAVVEALINIPLDALPV